MKRAAVILGALVFAATLIQAVIALHPAPVDLRLLVAKNMPLSGVEHPVTAVLLNYRGYDTLLEIAVLLLALVGLLAAGPAALPMPAKPGDAMLQKLARIATPPVIVVGIYLLWAGAFQPGGAFQAGAVLAAAAVLLHLSGLLPAWETPAFARRMLLASGFILFLAVSTALLSTGALLQYPPDYASPLILLIESGLTLSLAAILSGLFLFLSRDDDGKP